MKRIYKMLAVSLAILLFGLGIAGCGAPAGQTGSRAEQKEEIVVLPLVEETEADGESEITDGETIVDSESETAYDEAVVDSESETADDETIVDSESEAEGDGTETDKVSGIPQEEELLDPDGAYSSRDDVALYIHQYGKLPSNYISKKAAEKLGWEGGSLEPFAPGKAIGGSNFGNYEGILPKGKYTECDIDTVGAKKRGAKRIVFSTDGDIYYTEDHYESFTLLYTAEGPVTEEKVYR